MKIYIAASIPRVQEAHDLGISLEKSGYEILSYWHKDISERIKTDYHSTDRAITDKQGVQNCDIFIELVGDTNESRGGRHCELGLALAWEKKIILIGGVDDCIFTHLPNLIHVSSIPMFLKIQDELLRPQTEFQKLKIYHPIINSPITEVLYCGRRMTVEECIRSLCKRLDEYKENAERSNNADL